MKEVLIKTQICKAFKRNNFYHSVFQLPKTIFEEFLREIKVKTSYYLHFLASNNIKICLLINNQRFNNRVSIFSFELLQKQKAKFMNFGGVKREIDLDLFNLKFLNIPKTLSVYTLKLDVAKRFFFFELDCALI